MDAKPKTCALCGNSDEWVTMAMAGGGQEVWFHPQCGQEIYRDELPLEPVTGGKK